MKCTIARHGALFALAVRPLMVWLLAGLLQADAAVIVGPWLEGDSTTNVDVLVECDSAADMTVNYGTTTNLGMSAATSNCWTNSGAASDFIHRITLTGLQPNAVYYYQLTGQGAAATDYNFAAIAHTQRAPLTGLQPTAVYYYQLTGQGAAATDYNFATMPPTNLVAGITLAQAPGAVSNAVVAAASGRAVEKINRVSRLEGPQFYAYIADTLGPQLLTVNTNGDVLINAKVAPFADLPQAIQQAARAAVAGRLQVCRQASQMGGPFVLANSQSPYVVDYILNEDEPVFALLRETDGWVRATYGYYEDDPD